MVDNEQVSQYFNNSPPVGHIDNMEMGDLDLSCLWSIFYFVKLVNILETKQLYGKLFRQLFNEIKHFLLHTVIKFF